MKYICRPLKYKCHAALYEHDNEYFVALAGDIRLICSEGILAPCTRVYHASASGQILSYRPIIKMLGAIDISLAMTILEENILVVDKERNKASQLVRETLQTLEEFPDDDVHDLLRDVSSLYHELCKRSLKLHSKTLEC